MPETGRQDKRLVSIARTGTKPGGQAGRLRVGATPLPRLLDIPAVAEHLGISERHVRRLVADRRIPYLKVGGLVRFDPADIQDWLDHAKIGLRRIC